MILQTSTILFHVIPAKAGIQAKKILIFKDFFIILLSS